MVVKSGAKAALGLVNQTAPTGGVWNYQGFAIDIATTSDNANTTNPTKYLKDDGTEATVIADYARAIYSSGTFKNDGTTLLARALLTSQQIQQHPIHSQRMTLAIILYVL